MNSKHETTDRSPGDIEPERARSWGRALAYQLPALLVLAVLAIGLGWLSMKAFHARRQLAAVEALGTTGVVYDFQRSYDAKLTEHFNFAAEPPGPAAIRWLWGELVFANVVSLDLSEHRCKDLNPALLGAMTALDTLEHLSLENQPVGDSDLECLRDLPNLKKLNLSGTGISDETLRKLSGMKQLEELSVSQTEISGVGFVHLRDCPRLNTLWVCDVSFTPEGGKAISHLVMLETLCAGLWRADSTGVVGDEILEGCAKLQHLRYVAVDYRPVTDAGLRQLRDMPRLEDLHVEGTEITDRGLAYIAAVPSLACLYISMTNVTDAGLAHLRRLTQLEELHLRRTRVSDDGVRQLRMLQRITRLDLEETLITDQCLAVLCQLPILRSCNMQKTGVTTEGRRQILAELPQLTLY